VLGFLRSASAKNQHKRTEIKQAMAFFPFVGCFSPGGAKNNLQKKERTKLPQAKAVFCVSPNILEPRQP
jgi:hypothetical protein